MLGRNAIFKELQLWINISYCRSTYVIWWWEFGLRDKQTSDSITKFWWDLVIKSILQEDSVKIWVDSFIICCICVIKASLLAPSYDVSSCFYQFFYFTFKLPRISSKGLLLTTSSMINSRLSGNWSNISAGWIGHRYKEM